MKYLHLKRSTFTSYTEKVMTHNTITLTSRLTKTAVLELDCLMPARTNTLAAPKKKAANRVMPITIRRLSDNLLSLCLQQTRSSGGKWNTTKKTTRIFPILNAPPSCHCKADCISKNYREQRI
jgi:hypothetical protein